MPMKRKTKVRIARFTRQVPILREMQALRNESVLRLVVQAAFVGGCTGGVIGVFRWLYDHGNAWIVSTLRHGADDLATALIVFGTLILLALIVGQMVRKEPLISGSGIPQTELALAGQLPYPGFRIVASKFVGTLLSLSGGLSVGREGPSIQMGGAVGAGFHALWRPAAPHALTGSPYVVAGAVAGLAAAFGAPAAGVLFAFEEMKSRRDTSLIVAACASAIGAHLMIRIVFGMGRILPFAGFEAPPLSSFWIVALEGAVFGVLGVGYNKTLLWLHDREAGQTLIPDRWRALPPLLLAGCLALFAPLLIGGGESLIIFVGEHDVALKTLILLLAFKYLFAQYSTVASIPGGLLMPILCLGALWGRLWAELPVSALAAHGLPSGCVAAEAVVAMGVLFCGTVGSVQPYVLFGMVSYFAATVRAPLTGIVLVTEMSGTYTCLPGSLLAGLIACKVANLLHCPPVYDSLKERIRL